MIETGFKEFDKEFGGIPRGITLLSGDSGSCKTMAALSISNTIHMTTDLEVAYMSWEHDFNNICAMQAASLAGVNWMHIADNRDRLTPVDKEKLELVLSKLRERKNLYQIHGSLDVMDAKVFSVKYKETIKNCDVIFLDSINLFSAGYTEIETPIDAYDNIFKTLKEKSVKYNTSFVMLLNEHITPTVTIGHFLRSNCECWLQFKPITNNILTLHVNKAPKKSTCRDFDCWFNGITRQVKNQIPKGVTL